MKKYWHRNKFSLQRFPISPLKITIYSRFSDRHSAETVKIRQLPLNNKNFDADAKMFYFLIFFYECSFKIAWVNREIEEMNLLLRWFIIQYTSLIPLIFIPINYPLITLQGVLDAL